MTYPTAAVVTTNLDAGTDSPASARADILDAVTKLNQMMAHVTAFAATLLDDADWLAARATLGLPRALFQAYQTNQVNLTAYTLTTIPFNFESYDTGGHHNVSTGVFQPTVAGYYDVNVTIEFDTGSTSPTLGSCDVQLVENGATYIEIGRTADNTNGFNITSISGSQIRYYNGTTDYAIVQVRAAFASGNCRVGDGSNGTKFGAILITQ